MGIGVFMPGVRILAFSLFMMGLMLTQTVSAADTICVSVKADPDKVGAIGFMYEDDEGEQRLGSMGSSYSACDVPAGIMYSFGYRVHFYSSDIPCGATILTHDTNVQLDITSEGCAPKVN